MAIPNTQGAVRLLELLDAGKLSHLAITLASPEVRRDLASLLEKRKHSQPMTVRSSSLTYKPFSRLAVANA